MLNLKEVIKVAGTEDRWYMGSVYTHYPLGTEAAYRKALDYVTALWVANVKAFSPIVHSHPITRMLQKQPTHQWWLDMDQPWMEASHGMIYCVMEGYSTSRGLEFERKFFHDRERPILYWNVQKELILPGVCY